MIFGTDVLHNMESLDELREIMTCVVCLDTLSTVVVQCTRGHALCQDCRQEQLRCPSCRKPFLIDKPTLLCQIAAIVRGQCKFRGCTYIREKRNDDHQLWCGFMPTDCKLCDWSGYGKDMLSHVQEAHHAALVTNGSNNLMQTLDHCIRSKQFYVPFSALGLFFWLQIRVLNMGWENHHSVLALKVRLIPENKIDHDLYFNINFKSNNYDYDLRKKIQLKVLPNEVSDIKSCVFIPELVFNGGDGILKINIVKNEVQVTNSRLDVYSKYNLNRITDLCNTYRISDFYNTFKHHIEEITPVEIALILWIVVAFISVCFNIGY